MIMSSSLPLNSAQFSADFELRADIMRQRDLAHRHLADPTSGELTQIPHEVAQDHASRGTVDELGMTPVTEDRIRQIYDDFANGRLDRLAQALDEHVHFISNAPTDYFPYLGRRQGRAEVLKAFAELHEKLEIVSFCPLTVLVDHNDAALTVFMRIKDRTTGQFATFMAAHFLQFRNGLVAGYCGIIDSLKAVQQLTDRDL